MKKLLLILLLAASLPCFAQGKQTPDSNATPYGLPLLKSYVAPDVVERAKKKYGRLLYSIEKSTAADCQNSYLVGLIRNRRLSLEWMCDDAKMVWHNRKMKGKKAAWIMPGPASSARLP